MDPVVGTLEELYWFPEGVGILEPLTGMCAEYIGASDVSSSHVRVGFDKGCPVSALRSFTSKGTGISLGTVFLGIYIH